MQWQCYFFSTFEAGLNERQTIQRDDLFRFLRIEGEVEEDEFGPFDGFLLPLSQQRERACEFAECRLLIDGKWKLVSALHHDTSMDEIGVIAVEKLIVANIAKEANSDLKNGRRHCILSVQRILAPLLLDNDKK